MADDELAGHLSAELGGGVVTALTRLSGGASRETWRFELDGRPLVLQRQRRGDDRDMGLEASVVRAAGEAGVPVPHVVAASAGEGPLGSSWMVLTAVDGETIARKILRDDDYEVARGALTGQFARALARLHALDPAAVPGLQSIDQVAQYRAALDAIGEPHPAFELALRWLDDHRPPSSGLAVVHGDFRLGNVIVGAEGLRAVIDWELAHLGDPMEDLGWLCVRAWRFGSDRPVAGVGAYDELLRAYGEAAGHPADPEALRWWEVLGTLKWGVICISQANTHLSGATRSHELAAIGRRVCENEYDLFRALEGSW